MLKASFMVGLKLFNESVVAHALRLVMTTLVALCTLAASLLMFSYQQEPLSLMIFILSCTIMGSYFINQHHRLVPILLIIAGVAITTTTLFLISRH